MKMLSKIRALFNFKGEAHEINLSAAEIKSDKIFLHPEDDPKHTFIIKTKTVDILIEPNEEISEDNIEIIDTKNAQSKRDGESEPHFKPDQNSSSVRQYSLSKYLTKKKRMSILLYPEEYDMIMENIKTYGYKKTEYFLACVKSARKQSVDSAYKYYTKFYKEKHSEDIKRAREAQEKDYHERQMATQVTSVH